ncbi:MAG: acyl-CoA carboxylase subunit epsilon [Actinomycetota bacterium]|nr:acyl-CoA carboxylase subunit epsilon [Actinomycetota bacterium]
MDPNDGWPSAPEVRIVHGEPLDEELAALIAVIAALADAAAAEPPAPCSAWTDPAHRLRISLYTGPGAWRVSLLAVAPQG